MKNNETVYLKDGRKANYESKISESKHLVQVYTTYHDYEEEYEDLGETIVVDKVFKEAPIQIVSERIKQLEEQKMNLTKEVQQLNVDKRELTNYITQKTSFKKHIINKKEFMNAKSIAFFTSRDLTPTVFDKDKLRGLKISLHISIFKNEERAWGYKIYHDYGDYSEYIPDPKTDILFDKTQEEIDLIIKERVKKITDPSKISNNIWIRTDDKYLTKELIVYKKDIIDKEQKRDKADKLAKIEKLKKELVALEA